jgi:predicted small secreted protein
MKRSGGLLPMLWVAGVTMLCSGCNTVEGVGRDLERAGDAIQDEAEETRDRRRDD